jgi:Leucine-rich repeat (LRR) protein
MPLDAKVDELIMVAGTTGRLALRKRLFNRAIPLDVFRVSSVTDANMSHNDISEIPPQIATWAELKTLDLRHNNISQLPEQIGELESLTSLNISDNPLRTVPWSFGKCTALTELTADFSPLECLPAEISCRPAIDSVPYFTMIHSVQRGGTICKLAAWQFNNLPAVLLSMDHIQELTLVSNNLSQLPSDFTLLTALSKLQLSKNKFEEIPPPIYNLSGLASLDMADNSVSLLPPLPPNLVTLEELHLQGNRLGTVPRSIGLLLSLKVLDISFNQIAVLPDEIGSCASLLELRLHSNNMRALPSTMSCLRNLSELRVEANPLRMLHFRIGLLPLQKLTFDFATFESPPPEVMKKGVEWALNYFRRLCGSELRRVLVLDECGLFSYPSEIMYIPTLTRLSLMQNKLAVVPQEIALLTSLTDINFSQNVITEFADCCAGLTRLQAVNLSDNLLATLPFSLGSIKQLQKLVVLPNTQLLCPPLHVVEGGLEPTIRFLANVFQSRTDQCLDIGDFGLHFIPSLLAAESSITALRLQHSRFDDARSIHFVCASHLKELRLSNCALEFIPPVVSQCTRLEELDVSWNRLVHIGNEIRFCKALITLNISHNPVASLPDGLYLLSNFTNLVVEGVLTLIRPPLQVAQAGAPAVRQFQRTLERGVVTGRIDLTGVGLTDFACIMSAWPSMKELLIDGNAVVTLPSELALASSLQVLSCASCSLSSFPQLLNLQNSLTSLDIRGNTFGELPAEISVLSSLKKFRAANLGLLSTPSWFSCLSKLQELDLSSNNLRSISALSSLVSLVNLTKLNLENNGELHFPAHFERLRLLKALFLRGNGIRTLPFCLIQLTHLKDVDTAMMKELVMPPQELITKDWSYLSNFISQVHRASESQEMDLSSLQLRTFPSFVCEITVLRSLNISGNEISCVPEIISSLTCLTELNLKNCPIKSLPVELGSLEQLSLFHIDSQYLRESAADWGVADESMLLSVLRSLHIGRSQKQRAYDLSHCGLNNIPGHEHCTHGPHRGWTQALSLFFVGNAIADLDQLVVMQSLLTLNLAQNNISRLPDSFQTLSILTSLNLSGNFFTEMPILLSSFQSLRFLDFSYNKLVGIPQYFKGFTCLATLRISFNPISSLPFYFWAAPALNRVDTEGCSILSPPVPVIQFGVRTVVNYLEKVEQAHVSQTLSLVDYNLVDMPLEPLKVHGLTHLDLSRNMLLAIPESISLIHELATFAATHNRISSISEKISKLSFLKSMRLSHNKELVSLPESMATITSLTELMLDNCGFRSSPVEICGRGNLKSINLLDCPLLWPKLDILTDPFKTAESLAQFARTVASKFISFEGQKDHSELPVQLSCNAYLTDINVSNCSIKRIDGAMLVGMTSLTRLRLDRNLLSSLPDEICELVSLKDIRLSNNSLMELPFSMTALQRLSVFEATNNLFEDFPLAARYWPSIRAINLAGNSILSLPQWIGELLTIRKLNLSENQLLFIPTCLVLLTNLTSVMISGNKLRSPPLCLVDAGYTASILRYLSIIRIADTSLCLDKMNLTDVGDMEALSSSGHLQTLSCSMNPMTHLNHSVFHLPGLTSLNLSHCQFAEIPSSFTSLTQLVRLDMSYNCIVAAGASLGRCLHLDHLNLSYNSSLKLLEHSLGQVSLLSTLNVIGCRIEFPPPEVMKRGVRFVVRFLEVLRTANEGGSLHLRGFFLESLHERLYFPKCNVVSIATNQLRTLPDLISSYSSCTHMDLSGNMLQTLPASITNIKFLKILLLDDNMLSTLPIALGLLEQLRVLSLGHNSLKASVFPDKLASFSSLNRLILDSNPLQSLPPFVLSAPLKFLSVDSCDILSIPPDVSKKLSSLTELSLSNNKISALPDLSGWTALHRLKVSNNRLAAIPSTIQFLTSLVELSLSGNAITDAPVELGLLTNLSYLHLGDSFAGEIPQEILRYGGVSSVLAYLNKLKEARSTQEFDLRHLGLKHVPYVVKSIPGLRKLSFDGNLIAVLPLWLCDILSLTEISLLLCPISSLPVSLARLTNLTNLRLPPGGILFPPPATVAAGTKSILNYLSSILQHKDSGICALNGMNLVEMPVELCRCDFITHLDLRDNGINQIPPEIALLTRLKELRLEGCPIDAAWTAVLNRGLLFLQQFCARALVDADQPGGGYIDLSNTQINSVPSSVFDQQNIVSFVANSNPIVSLPSSLQCCTALTQISLVHCKLAEISEAFVELQSLVYLDLSHNQLTQLPDHMKNMTNLQNLNVSCNPITSIDAVKFLCALVHLNIQGTCLADVPLAIAKLPHIESVLADWSSFPSLPLHHTASWNTILAFVKLLGASFVSSNVSIHHQGLLCVPCCVLSWKSVVTIDFSFNDLNSVDDAIFELPLLQELNVSNNSISVLPHALHCATRLLKLDVRNNPISRLPVALGACVKPNFEMKVDTHLLATPSQEFISRGMKELLKLFWIMWSGFMSRQLEINELKLCVVPENIFDIGHLLHLSLCRNDLRVLPPSIGSLTLLKRLDVSFNDLNALCPELCRCVSLLEVIVDGNPMLAHCPPKPLLTAGISFVRQYLRVLMLAAVNGHLNILETPTPGVYLKDIELPPCHTLNLCYRAPSLMNSFVVSASHSQLGDLTSLCMLHCGISQIPSFVSTLTGLKSLNMGFNNRDVECDFQLHSCLSLLQKLFLHSCSFTRVPEFVFRLSSLHELCLSDNFLHRLPDGFFTSFPNLVSFTACSCGFEDIESSILTLHSTLVTLDLSFNPIPSHNLAQLVALSSLKRISVFGCGVVVVPPRWGSLKSIEFVGIEENGLENVPPQVVRGGGQLIARYLRLIDGGPATVELDISGMHLEVLPSIVHTMRSLQILNVSDNPLLRLPSWLGELHELQSFHCRNLPLTRLPATLGALPKLSILDCSGCPDLKSPPENIVSSGFAACINYMRRCYKAIETNHLDVAALGICEFPYGAASSPSNMLAADAKGNFINIITPEIKNFCNLRLLDLSDNSLRTLPWEIGFLNCLESLMLQKNPLHWLPFTIGSSSSLHTLLYDTNHVIFPSRSVSMLGCQASIAFLQGFYGGWSCGNFDVSHSVVKLQCMPPELLLLMATIDVRRFDNIMANVLKERSDLIETRRQLAVTIANQDYLLETNVLRMPATPGSSSNRNSEAAQSPMSSPVRYALELYQSSQVEYNFRHNDAVRRIGRVYLGHLGRRYFTMCAQLMLGISASQDLRPIPAFDRFVHKVTRPVTAEFKQRHSYEAFIDRTSKHFVFDSSSQQLRARPQTSPVKIVSSFQRMMQEFETQVAEDLELRHSFAATTGAVRPSSRANLLRHMPPEVLSERQLTPTETRGSEQTLLNSSHIASSDHAAPRPLSTSSAVSAAHEVLSTVLNGVVGAASIEDHPVASGTPRATSSSQTATSDFTSIFAATPITPSYHAALRSRGATARFTVPAPLNITIGGEEYNESSPVHRALLMSASRVTCASEFDALWLNQDGAVLSACDDDHHILQPTFPSNDALQALQFAEPVLDDDVAREAEQPCGDESSCWNDMLQSSKLWVEIAAPGDWVRLNPSTLAASPLPAPALSCSEYSGTQEAPIRSAPLTAVSEPHSPVVALVSMNFADSGLTRIPTWVVSLSTLTSLDVSNNRLGHFPLSVASLVHLVSLRVDGCAIENLPAADIWPSPSLKFLSLDNNSLQSVSALQTKPSLESLSVSKNSVRKLIVSPGGFRRLRSLDLSDNPLVALVVAVGSCPALEYLNLQSCRITVLSPSVARCACLKVLLMSFSRVATLPPTIGMLTVLHTLHLRRTRIHLLPPEIACCVALRDVNLAENDMLEPPQCVIDSGVAVTMSYMSRIIESRRQGCARLDSFNLGVVPLAALASYSLRSLELRRNGIAVIPHAISLLTCLSELSLSHNSIKFVPDELLYVSTLNVLSLDNNEISSLPFAFGNLRRLQVLDLSHNNLQQLPISLGDVRGMVSLTIDSNPLAYTLKLLAQQSSSAVLEFLRALHDGQASGTLYLSGRGLFDVPRECGSLSNLRRIVMKDNQLKALPVEVFRELCSVVSVDLSYNNFQELPEGILPLTQLQQLDMSHNPLKHVGAGLCTLTRLHTLVFEDCPVQSFPWAELKLLSLLETLAIETVDPSLSPDATVPSELKGSAAGMYISSLSQCRSNGVLDLAELGLAVLPPVIVSYAFLASLNVNGNYLLCLPESISKLTQLQELSCMDNRLRTLPSSIGACAALVRLNVACNRMASLPAQLAMLRKLKVIYINDNPELMCPPPKGSDVLSLCYLLCFCLTSAPQSISRVQSQYCSFVSGCCTRSWRAAD